MIEYSGKRVTTVSEAVTGRLLAAKSLSSKKADGAAILIWDGCCELSADLLDGAVGMILPDFLDSDKKRFAAHLAEFCHLPAISLSCPLPLKDSSSRYDIAILAPIQGKLFVNPDIETVSSYLYSHPHGIKKRISVLSTDSDAPEGYDGLVLGKELERFNDEESAYEYFCEIADKNTGVKLVSEIPLGENCDIFSARISALYRAGVWGRFSLLCTEVNTPQRAQECLSLIRSVFCRLDSTGREFNGFIPKGISIDTPLLLLNPPNNRALDFFCLDISSLCKNFPGGKPCDNKLIEAIEKYLLEAKRKALPAEISIKPDGSITPEFIERISPKEIYADSRLAARILTWI